MRFRNNIKFPSWVPCINGEATAGIYCIVHCNKIIVLLNHATDSKRMHWAVVIFAQYYWLHFGSTSLILRRPCACMTSWNETKRVHKMLEDKQTTTSNDK